MVLEVRSHSGYNQRVREEGTPKTAFKCRFGNFEYTVTRPALRMSPSSFQALMNSVLNELL